MSSSAYNEITPLMARLTVQLLLALLAANALGAELTDDSGRTVKFDKPFRRIISLYAGHTENLFTLGLDREIIGVSGHETNPRQATKRKAYRPADDPERFLASGCDLVLVRPMTFNTRSGVFETLEKAGIRVVSMQPRSIQDMYAYWKKLGLLTGREKEADEMILRFKGGLERIRGLTSGLKEDERKRVFIESIHAKLKTVSPDSFAAFALETAGGVNAAADAVPSRGSNVANYGIEKILSKAESIDVYIAQSGTMNRVTVERIKDTPGFSAIRAVRENRVYTIDEESLSRPTMRLMSGIESLGRLLYPELFAGKGK